MSYFLVGGARIGGINFTWPFASLEAKNGRLILKVPFFETMIFNPDNLIELKPYKGFLSKGIEIKHNVPKYDAFIVFWLFKEPEEAIKKIREAAPELFSRKESEEESLS